MLILGIESSCDDTSVALLRADKHKFEILAEKTASQIEVHKKYGGVVPEIAGRKHAEKILPLIEEVLRTYHIPRTTYQDCKPDVIAVTAGPGLMTGLLVGIEAAKTLSYLWNVPLVRVNHIEGHVYSVLLEKTNNKKQITNKFQIPIRQLADQILYPALALIVSGGHTELIYIKKQGHYKLVGKTRDDAAGECFDKIAKLLGLDYPGGPQISKLAETGNPKAIPFPRPMIDDESFDFSFSGLKTSALYWLQNSRTTYHVSHTNLKQKTPHGTCYVLRDTCLSDFCASFEQAIIDVLVTKTIRAAKKYKTKTFILGGGVSANRKLKESLTKKIAEQNPLSSFLFPLSSYSMDNSAMIAVSGYFHAIKKDFTKWQKLDADPNWKIAV